MASKFKPKNFWSLRGPLEREHADAEIKNPRNEILKNGP